MDRRIFMKSLAGGAALSVAALNELNAALYAGIEKLNRDFLAHPSPDGVYWDELSKYFMFQDKLVMMNNGTLGPMPESVFNTTLKYFRMQCADPYACYTYLPVKRVEVREKLARFVGASADEVAITRNTTEGMNLAAGGIDFVQGDEVIISSMEHPAGYHPWRIQEKRYGIKLVKVPLGVPPKSVDEIVDAFTNAITPRTKVISVSHTVYITGLIFPIKELSEITRERGILLIADSAHGFGMLELNLDELGADVFCSSPYKWGGAPTGTGLMYVRKDMQDKIWPQIVNTDWEEYDSAKRFECLGQRNDPLILGLGEAIDFYNIIHQNRIEARVKSLAAYLKQGLKSIPKVRLHTSEDPYLSAGLTAFSVDGADHQYIVDYIREKYNIVIRTIGRDEDKTSGIRISTPVYTNTGHIDKILEGIHHIARKKA